MEQQSNVLILKKEVESYAYQFIHQDMDFDMKFDVIIGNPPYHIQDGSGNEGKAYKQIYNLFVEQSMKLKPRYLCMITPSRWFVTGKGLDSFRKNMLSSRNFKTLVHPKTLVTFLNHNLLWVVFLFYGHTV